MRTALVALLAFGCFAGAAAGQSSDEAPPPQCRYNAAGQMDYQACLDASAPGTPWRMLAHINLGTNAFMQADYAAAVRHYDAAQPGGGETFYSDAAFHAYYASTLQQVGRADEALVQARRALAVLRNDPSLPAAVRARFGTVQVDREFVFAAILPVLHDARDPETSRVRAEFMALPVSGWWTWANRAGVLEQMGDIAAALEANGQAIALAPNEVGVLNNQCYILFRAERAADALAYCERAKAAGPGIASVRHSLAATLAALGRCQEAAAELAEARRLDPVSAEYQRELACAAH